MSGNEDTSSTKQATPEVNAARREFFRRYGHMAVAAPAIALLLSTTLSSPAIAHSGGRGPVPS
jgi:hypothetical protein